MNMWRMEEISCSNAVSPIIQAVAADLWAIFPYPLVGTAFPHPVFSYRVVLSREQLLTWASLSWTSTFSSPPSEHSAVAIFATLESMSVASIIPGYLPFSAQHERKPVRSRKTWEYLGMDDLTRSEARTLSHIIRPCMQTTSGMTWQWTYCSPACQQNGLVVSGLPIKPDCCKPLEVAANTGE